MHPISSVLLLVGYAMALPIMGKIAETVRNQRRIAFAGHQAGMVVAMLGWVLAGRQIVVVAHLVWIVIARIWFWRNGQSR